MACSFGYTAIAKILSRHPRIDMAIPDCGLRVPLYLAVRGGHTETVRLLLENRRIRTDALTRGNVSVLWAACSGGFIEIIEALLRDVRCDVRSADAASGRTPLAVACEKGQAHVAMLLMKTQGVNVNTVDHAGRSPLWHAARGGHKTIVQALLRSKACDVRAADHAGVTPFAASCIDAHVPCMRVLLQDARTDAGLADARGVTPFHRACRAGSMEAVVLLADHGNVDIARQDHAGLAGVHIAALAGNIALLEFIARHPRLRLADTDKLGRNALHIAAMNGYADVVEMLLLDEVDEVVHLRHLREARLLERDEDEAAEEKAAMQALAVASAAAARKDQGGEDDVDAATDAQAKPLDDSDKVGDAVVTRAADNSARDGHGNSDAEGDESDGKGVEDEAEVFVAERERREENVDDDNEPEAKQAHGSPGTEAGGPAAASVDDGEEPFDAGAALAAADAAAEAAAQAAVDAAERERAAKEAAEKAAADAEAERIANITMVRRFHPLTEDKHEGRYCPFYFACLTGDPEVFQLMLRDERTTAATNGGLVIRWRHGLTPMYVACQRGHIELVKMMLDHGQKFLDRTRSRVEAAAAEAAEKAAEEDKRRMVRLGPFAVAKFRAKQLKELEEERQRTLQAIADECSIVDDDVGPRAMLTAETNDGETPFYAVCQCGHKLLWELLHVREDVDVCRTNNRGRGPFFTACEHGHSWLVEAMLQDPERRFDDEIGRPDVGGHTPLWAACAAGNTEVVRLLLDANADPTASNGRGETCFWAACANGATEVAKLLLGMVGMRKVDETKLTKSGVSPLWAAAFGGWASTLRFLLTLPSTLELTINRPWGARSESPFFAACANGHCEAARVLGDDPRTDVAVLDSTGATPLCAAASAGFNAVVTYLLSDSRTDIDTLNGDGHNALTAAWVNDRTSVIELLEADGRFDRAPTADKEMDREAEAAAERTGGVKWSRRERRWEASCIITEVKVTTFYDGETTEERRENVKRFYRIGCYLTKAEAVSNWKSKCAELGISTGRSPKARRRRRSPKREKSKSPARKVAT